MQYAKQQLRRASPAARELGAWLRQRARALGCDAVGIADPAARPDRARFERWVSEGLHAGMDYLARRVALRCDPDLLLPGVRAILCVAVSYHVSRPAPMPKGPRISRYAWASDYHPILRAKLHALRSELCARVPGVRARVAVDTAPLLERHWAAQAGLGWIGRNGCLIVPGFGSWVFLGELLCDLPLPADRPVAARCGRCRRCLEACPTGALIAPGRLDARRCIAYWTVEHRGAFSAQTTPPTAPWLFGCDRCQEVCPGNRGAGETREPAFRRLGPWCAWDTRRWAQLDAAGFARELGGSALQRAGLFGVQRNLRALGDAARSSAPPRRRDAGTDGDAQG
ncbi:MAG: tRNA epoxyqueuosine(34) reductase QueG [Candidatus Eisenbacteria bacterium]|nr:tRNA epoxyqueuosine(34) reductase QueG [Candidatus Eisenbacteria bacterium]